MTDHYTGNVGQGIDVGFDPGHVNNICGVWVMGDGVCIYVYLSICIVLL